MESMLCSNGVVSERFLLSVMQAVAIETALVAIKSFVCSLPMVGSLSCGSDIFPKVFGAAGGFPIAEFHPMRKIDPEMKDAGETEEDEDKDDHAAADNQDGDKGNDDEDQEDEPEANGDGANSDEEENDDEDKEDEDEDEDDEEEGEEEEEEDEDIPQPPTKKRK